MKGFDWRLLKGRRTISINRAFENFEPTIIFTMDTRFMMWLLSCRYGEKALNRYLRLPGYKAQLLTYTASIPVRDLFIVRVHQNYQAGYRAFTESLADGIGHGNNGGYAALNLAVCMGANPIYLLGYDMRHKDIVGKDGQLETLSHYHSGHPLPQMESDVEGFIKYFNHASSIIRERGIDVVNLNPDSSLRCFPKMKPEEVLH